MPRFEEFDLSMIGAGGQPGDVKLIDEVKDLGRELAQLVLEKNRKDGAEMTIKVKFHRVGESSVAISGNVTGVKRPARLRATLIGIVTDDGSLVTQSHKQLALGEKLPEQPIGMEPDSSGNNRTM